MRALAAATVLAAGSMEAARAADNSFFSKGEKPPTAPRAVSTTGTSDSSLADIEAAENALADLSARSPFTARHVMFVKEKAELYGGYDQRSSAVFGPGEKLITYLEPVGFGWKRANTGLFTFGITTDFEIATPSGKILGGQRAFQHADLTSHARNREFFVNLTLTLDGIDPGDYVLIYTLHDNVGGRTKRVEQPFTIKASG